MRFRVLTWTEYTLQGLLDPERYAEYFAKA